MTNPTNPAACDHEYRTANMSGERFARCLKCGQPEPIRARPNLGKLIVGVAKGEYPSGSTVDPQGNISPSTNPADGDVVTHDMAEDAAKCMVANCAQNEWRIDVLFDYIAQQRAKEAKNAKPQCEYGTEHPSKCFRAKCKHLDKCKYPKATPRPTVQRSRQRGGG